MAKVGQYPIRGFARPVLGAALTRTQPNGANAAIAANALLESGATAYTLSADAAAYVLTGQTADTLFARTQVADAAAFVIGGQDATFARGVSLSADAGTFDIAGQDTGNFHGHLTDAQPGAFTFAGQDAQVLHANVVDAQPGAFTITGADATLTQATALVGRFWVGGTGTWDTTTTTNWSATDGGAGGASVPTATDNVYFTALSNTGTGAFTVTIGAAVVCKDFDSSAVDGVMTLAGFSGISVSGSMTLKSTNVWTLTGAITFKGTTAGLTITTNGVVVSSSIIIQATGAGTYALGSSYTNSGSRFILLTSGTFSTNNHAVSVYGIDLQYAGSAVRAANLGSSVITVGQGGWSVVSATNLTLNAGTSTINLSSGLPSHYFGGSSLTYYDINVTYVDSTYVGLIRDNVVCRNFSFTAITTPLSSGVRGMNLLAGKSITCSGTFSCPASVNHASRTTIGIPTTGTFYLGARITISAATFDLNDINVFGVDFTGAGAPATGTSISDLGRNTGVTFTTAKTVYKVAASSAWINSATWATTSGGTGSSANAPLGQDTIIIDDNSGSGLSGAGYDTKNTAFGTLNASARTTTFTFTLGTQEEIFTGGGAGGITTNSNFVWSGSSLRLVMAGTGTFDLNTPASFALGSGNLEFIVWKPSGGSVRLLNNVQITNNTLLRLTAGDLNLNGYTLKYPGRLQIDLSGTDTKSTTFGNGGVLEIVLTSIDTPLTFTDCTYYSVNSDTVTGLRPIVLSGTTATAYTSIQTFAPTGITESNAHDITMTGSCGGVSYWSWEARNLDFSTATVTGTLSNLFASRLYGNLILGTGLGTLSGTGVWSFKSTSATQRTINTAGKTATSPVEFTGVGGSWALAGNFTQSGVSIVTHTAGTLSLSSYTLTTYHLLSSGTTTRGVNFGSGNLVVSSATPIDFTGSNNTNVAGTGTITINTAGATAKVFAGGGNIFPTVVNVNTGAMTISGSNTFNSWQNSGSPTTWSVTSGTTQTFVNDFELLGTVGNLVVLTTTAAGTATLTKASGVVSCDYLNISKSVATGGATWYAGANSTNGGSNTGWIFTAPPGAGYTLDAQPDAFTISGQDAQVLHAHLVDAQPASFSLTGQDATFARGFALDAQPGAFDLALIDTGAFHGHMIDAQPASFSLTGQDATLAHGIILEAQPAGMFVTAGADTTTAHGHFVDAQPGSFTVAGQDATLLHIKQVVAEAGAFAITLIDADLNKQAQFDLHAEAATFDLTGQDAALTMARAMSASSASFTISGAPATFALGLYGFPDPADVRLGVVYGPAGQFTGTMRTKKAMFVFDD